MPYAELGHLKPVESGWLWMGPSELHFDIGHRLLWIPKFMYIWARNIALPESS
jgi:hypothetical protein